MAEKEKAALSDRQGSKNQSSETVSGHQSSEEIDSETESAHVENKDSTAIIFNNEIEIFSNKRLPHLDQGPVQAYAASYLDKSSKAQYFAMLCERHLTPRASKGPSFAAIANPSLVRLIASGTIYWPPSRCEKYIFIYENNLGHPLMTANSLQGLALKSDIVLSSVIRPIINVLIDLRDADLTHGNIRPTNMFDGGATNFERVILGECLSGPPSYAQPAVFESIDRAICDPIARGLPRFDDDLYSFGISLAMLLRSRNPLAGLSDEEVIKQKIEIGSYSAITGKDRFTGPILELLRGILQDDRSQRWALEDVGAWLDGQRLSPKQSGKKVKSTRPLHFHGERYFRPSILAMDIQKSQAEAIQIIDNGNLSNWIERSLEDHMTSNRYNNAIEIIEDQGRGPGYWDMILSRISIALDPEAPIRFKHMKIHPEGFPFSLSEAFVQKKELQPYADIINSKIINFWLNSQIDIRVDIGSLSGKYEGCKSFLRQSNIGYGIERCLYYLNSECPCLSDKLKNYYVRTPEDLLHAFEDMSSLAQRSDMFLDRHIVAFLSVKERQVIDPFLHELSSKEYFHKVIANLKCLATIQKRSKMDPFPGICDWITEMLPPVYERFHDRILREKLQERVQKIKGSGDISKIVGLLDNTETIRRDMSSFRQAMQEYHDLREENLTLESKLKQSESFGKETGKEVAAIFSAMLSGVIIFGLTFYFLVNGSPF